MNSIKIFGGGVALQTYTVASLAKPETIAQTNNELV